MVLTGLILLPMLALPTLMILKKNFQIKFFYTFVSLIHFGFSIGLLTKYGYFFEGSILTEKLNLSPELGLSYSISTTALDLLLCNLISLLYFLFGAVNLKIESRRGALCLMTSESMALLAVLSDNLLLTALALFLLFLVTSFAQKEKLNKNPNSHIFIYIGFTLLVGVSLVFGILYESIYNMVDLDLAALSKMRTPFVKGSFYSTQFNLALIFAIGFALYTLFALKEWVSSFYKGLFFNSFILTVVSLYTAFTMFEPLFPEVYSVYIPWAEGSKFYLLILFATATMCTVFMEFFGAFAKRGNDV